MRSKANFQGHPIHPILIAFPIGFAFGALGFDVAGRLGNWPSVWSTGGYLSAAAVISGLVAAIPGLIDYFTVVPPGSSAKKRATYHMLVNVCSLVLIAGGWIFRNGQSLWPANWTIVLEAGGICFMTVGGWLGGTLVYRNQIGVDHRYAQAGKWKEEHAEGKPGEAVKVATADELKVGQMKLVHLGDRRIVVARLEDGHVAFDDHCTHKGGPLSDGVLACGMVTCPWHGSQFNVITGDVESGPAEKNLHTYAVEETGGEVRVVAPAEEHAVPASS